MTEQESSSNTEGKNTPENSLNRTLIKVKTRKINEKTMLPTNKLENNHTPFNPSLTFMQSTLKSISNSEFKESLLTQMPALTWFRNHEF